MKNHQVAGIFRNLANLLEMRGEGIFRIRAYHRAAQLIEGLTEDIGKIALQGGLTQLPGIGKDLAGKIQEIIETGTLALYEEIKNQIPPALLAFLSLPGLQPQMARYLFEELGIRNLEDLEQMVRTHMLRTVPGFGKAVEDEILRGIQTLREASIP
mgnify:CR=1 FL=1